MKIEPIYFINGKFVKKSKATISVIDLGLVRGYGVFDFLITYNLEPFLLSKHLQRLATSAKLLEISYLWNNRKLEEIIKSLISKNSRLGDLQIRIILTGGESNDGVTPLGKPSLIITADKKHVYPESFYTKGVRVITVESGRIFPEAKTLNYIQAIKAMRTAEKARAIEAIYVNNNIVLEGTRSNIFIIKNNKIITPNSGIFAGLARETAISICKSTFEFEEMQITTKELYTADEVFITSTLKQIMPVVNVDNKKIGSGKVGEITKKLIFRYKSLTSQS